MFKQFSGFGVCAWAPADFEVQAHNKKTRTNFSAGALCANGKETQHIK